MKSLWQILGGLALPFVVLACAGESKTLKADAPGDLPQEVSADLESDNYYLLCNKKIESAIFPDEAQENTQIIEDVIPLREYSYHRCNGEVTQGQEPIFKFTKYIDVEPPKDLRRVRRAVNFVKVKNYRGCNILMVKTGQPNLSLLENMTMVSSVSKRGRLTFRIHTDEQVRMHSGELGVLEGKNVVEVRYYGKCLKYKEKVNEKLDDSYNCLEAEILGSKWLTLDVRLAHPLVEGHRDVREPYCDGFTNLDKYLKNK
ncbi:hypothetical protein [Bdellovibrio sp. HCB337]|uniref:hypothetical protein n=1 Tax=Bdellovibrio sp. HCB337 TaxID=3394358 RepID=UPI0039A4D542